MITASELKLIADKANDNSNDLLNNYLTCMEKEAKKGKYHLNVWHNKQEVEWYEVEAFNRLRDLGFRIGIDSQEIYTENEFTKGLEKCHKFRIEWFN